MKRKLLKQIASLFKRRLYNSFYTKTLGVNYKLKTSLAKYHQSREINNRNKTMPGLVNLRDRYAYGLQKPETLPEHLKSANFNHTLDEAFNFMG
ncbi:hypothetical protein QQG55_38635 [Brugia pahangi]